MVAPVYFGHATKRHVYLPQGLWRDFWDGSLYQGGWEVIVAAELDQIPVFAKAGSIIPLLDPSPDTLLPVVDQPDIKVAGDDLRLQVYPGSDGHFQLYDGSVFTWDEQELTLQIELQPVKRWVSVHIMGELLKPVKVIDPAGNPQPTQRTNLNGDPDHIRFSTDPGVTYRATFAQ
jgi:alpha-glucosidase (family GH31 glycosyl hydrolase)